jgi:uncharacterized protein YdaU (DUF1376 family)
MRLREEVIAMRLPFFQFWAGDWLSSQDITVMTLAQEGAYIRLLCYAWQSLDCSIPADRKVLSRTMLKGIDVGALEAVLKKWESHPQDPTKLRNPRLYKEWLKARSKQVKSRQAAHVRWGKEQSDMRPHTSGTCSSDAISDTRRQMPDSIEQKPSLKSEKDSSIDFNRFQEAWNAQATAKGWQVCSTLNDKLKSTIRDRCREHEGFLACFREAIEWADESWMRGEWGIPGKNTKATLSWALQPGKIDDLLDAKASANASAKAHTDRLEPFSDAEKKAARDAFYAEHGRGPTAGELENLLNHRKSKGEGK